MQYSNKKMYLFFLLIGTEKPQFALEMGKAARKGKGRRMSAAKRPRLFHKSAM